GATGLGKPLKSILHGRQIPIYIASIGPKSVEQAAEIADGWLPIFFSPKRFKVYRDSLEAGFRKAGGGKSLKNFDVAPSVTVIQGDDVESCLGFLKPMLALYIGGMGARGKNFYNDLARRYGFEDAAKKIQDLYLDGKKNDAIAAVPDELADEISLCGPKERIRDRLAEWKESGITTMILALQQVEAMRTVAEAVA
ncbi:MAG: LLM class flavin-dependent oxidoreductase, partial [Candidatus Binatia bacterium]